MDPVKKARVRLRERIHRGEHTMGNYEKLARELEGSARGKALTR